MADTPGSSSSGTSWGFSPYMPPKPVDPLDPEVMRRAAQAVIDGPSVRTSKDVQVSKLQDWIQGSGYRLQIRRGWNPMVGFCTVSDAKLAAAIEAIVREVGSGPTPPAAAADMLAAPGPWSAKVSAERAPKVSFQQQSGLGVQANLHWKIANLAAGAATEIGPFVQIQGTFQFHGDHTRGWELSFGGQVSEDVSHAAGFPYAPFSSLSQQGQVFANVNYVWPIGGRNSNWQFSIGLQVGVADTSTTAQGSDGKVGITQSQSVQGQGGVAFGYNKDPFFLQIQSTGGATYSPGGNSTVDLGILSLVMGGKF